MHLFLLLSISCSKVIVCTYLINILSVSYLCVPFSRLFWRWRSFALCASDWQDRRHRIPPFQLPTPLQPFSILHNRTHNRIPNCHNVFNSTQRNSRGSHEPLRTWVSDARESRA